MIDITLIGTAALLPLPERALAAAHLACGGHSILFDCGEGTQTAARRAGVSLMKTDMIALTHYHGDHVFGIPGLLQTMFSMGRTQPLYITGPEGLRQALAPILHLAGGIGFEVRFVDLPPEGLSLAELMHGWPFEAVLTPFPTAHRVPSQGYAFTLGRAGKFLPERARALGVPVTLWGLLQKGRTVQTDGATVRPEQVMGPARKGLKFVFTGDTAPCDTLTDAAAGADLLICEATYGENEQAAQAAEYGHMTFAGAAQAAKAAGVKRLWLTHYSQMIEDPQAYLANAAEIFENTVCGRDGLSLTLRFEP